MLNNGIIETDATVMFGQEGFESGLNVLQTAILELPKLIVLVLRHIESLLNVDQRF